MESIKAIISTAPFYTCTIWSILFAISYGRLDKARRILMCFALVCSALYLCHAMYFLGDKSTVTETLWKFCNMTVYPLYFIYLCKVTSKGMHWVQMCLILLPGLIVAGLCSAFDSAFFDLLQKLTFALQVLLVVYFGYRRLTAFDRKVCDVYANTDSINTERIRIILVFFLVTSVLSLIINALGRAYFKENCLILAFPSLMFSAMLFSLLYIGYNRTFTYEQFEDDRGEVPLASHEGEDEGVIPCIPSLAGEDGGGLREAIIRMVDEELIYLNKNLKVGDIATACNSNRTYVSNFINEEFGYSFSDYINKKRVEHAQRLMRESKYFKIAQIADESGFSSEQSFYRNFKKYTGQSPMEWIKRV